MASNPPQKLGTVVRSSRTRRGISQEQLGKNLGLSQVAISKLELGKWRIDELSILSRLAAELNLPFKKLVDLTVKEMTMQ